jgi:hypothetical protein
LPEQQFSENKTQLSPKKLLHLEGTLPKEKSGKLKNFRTKKIKHKV